MKVLFVENDDVLFLCQKYTKIRSCGLDDKNYRLYPCYEDVADPSTLQFWLIYYEPK